MAIDLWKPVSKETVLESVIKYKDEEEINRKRLAKIRKDIFYDNWEWVLDEELDNQFYQDNYERMRTSADTSDNIFKKTMQATSNVYTKPVNRGFSSEVDLRDIYAVNYAPDRFWGKANNLTNALNDLIIHVAIEYQTLKVKPIVLTPDRVGVVQDMQDPEKIVAIWYDVDFHDTKNETIIIRYYWDYENHYVIDMTNEELLEIPGNEKNINPYEVDGQKILPFVYIHRDPIAGQFWNITGGDDLVCSTILNGVKRTTKNYLAKVACFKQLSLQGDFGEDQAPMLLDPLTVLRLEPNASAEMLDYTADFDGLIKNIKYDVNSTLETYGLKAEDFKATAESGKALEIKNSALRKIREGQIPIFRQAELEFWDITKVVFNYHNDSNQIKEDTELRIDYPEMSIYATEESAKEADWVQVERGMMNINEYHMKYNPDIKTKKDSEEIIEQNLEDYRNYQNDRANLNDLIEGE